KLACGSGTSSPLMYRRLWRTSTVSPATAMTRLIKSVLWSTGDVKTTMSSCCTGRHRASSQLAIPNGRSTCRLYASLLTNRWSPIWMVGSIDPDGTQKASSGDERTRSAPPSASSSDSTCCRQRDLGSACACVRCQNVRREGVDVIGDWSFIVFFLRWAIGNRNDGMPPLFRQGRFVISDG